MFLLKIHGKSTIINLINRFYEIDSGTISVDGIPVQEYELTSLRNQIAVVLQDVFLFSDSIIQYFNIDGIEKWMLLIPLAVFIGGFIRVNQYFQHHQLDLYKHIQKHNMWCDAHRQQCLQAYHIPMKIQCP